MKSESNLHELIVTPVNNCRILKMPRSHSLEQALQGFICSDLFINGFSYKPLTLTMGVVAPENQYHLLKHLKNARFIHDSVKHLPAKTLLQKLEEGDLTVESGYIGFNTHVSQSVTDVRLTDKENLFGIELKAGKRFRFFAKGESSNFPKQFIVDDCLMEVIETKPIPIHNHAFGILQNDLSLVESLKVSKNSLSRFKISFNEKAGILTLCAGSVIDKNDYFGRGIII